MLRRGFAGTFRRSPDLLLRVHILRSVRRTCTGRNLPKLRWRIGGQAPAPAWCAWEISGINAPCA